MDLPDFLNRESSGEIRLARRRIGLYHFVSYYNDGYSPEMLAGQFPDVSLSLIHKVIGFYLENKTEVDDYIAHCKNELQQQRAANPRRLHFTELRERLEQMQHEGP
jgi:uncharacterized protein (DUF433 family)